MGRPPNKYISWELSYSDMVTEGRLQYVGLGLNNFEHLFIDGDRRLPWKKMHYPYGECEKNSTPFAILFFLLEDGKKQQMTIILL